MKQLEKIHLICLFIFIIGLFLLGIEGYGIYSKGIYRTSSNPIFLPFAIALIIPYIISTFVKIFYDRQKQNDQKIVTNSNAKILVEKGKTIIVDFEKSIKKIIEIDENTNLDLEIIKESLFPIVNCFNSNEHIKKGSLIIVEYKVDYKKYYKDFTLPFNAKSTQTIFKLKKNTILYYDENNPSNSVIDLKFLEEFI